MIDAIPDLEGYELAYSEERMGRESFGMKLYVMRPPATVARIAALDRTPRPDGSLTPRERSSTLFYDVGREVMEKLEMQSAELDPAVGAQANLTAAELTACFVKAGLGPIFVERIPNKYWGPADPMSLRHPWLLVTTRLGHFEIGWRKRVINIDWSRTTIGKRPDLFLDQGVTVGDTYVHAYGYEKAGEYLARLGALK